MFLPLSDDNPRYSFPFVNYLLIGLNVGVFLLTGLGMNEAVYERFGMKPALLAERPLTLITSMFLHGGLVHLIGNMWFLWISGDNVEDALGHAWYLLVYLAGGICAGLIHAALTSGEGARIPTVGASGAISAVMGLYMVVFPHNRIRIVYFFYFIGTFWARAGWVIGAWFVGQLAYLLATAGPGVATGVAYGAHVGGFVFGAGLAVLLRALYPNVDPHRRHAGQRPRTAGVIPGAAPPVRGVSVTLGPTWASGRPAAPRDDDVAIRLFSSPEEMERTMERRLVSGDVAGAQHLFGPYVRSYPHRAMNAQLELNLIQSLARRQEYAAAAQGLEHFLATRPDDVNVPEAKLALGLLYTRHLGRVDRGRVLLGAAAVQHPVRERAAVAREELASLG